MKAVEFLEVDKRVERHKHVEEAVEWQVQERRVIREAEYC